MPATSIFDPINYDPTPIINIKDFGDDDIMIMNHVVSSSSSSSNSISSRSSTTEESTRELDSGSETECIEPNDRYENSIPIMRSLESEKVVLPEQEEPSLSLLPQPHQQQQQNLLMAQAVPCPVMKSYTTFSSKFIAELEIITELIASILYAVWGIAIAVFMTFIPRRFRYKDVTGQVILITGAGSGIGKLMAQKFALKHGARVVAWDINEKGNEETVASIRSAGGQCYGFTVDVSSRETIYAAAKKVKAQVGKVDILINNAGIVSGKRLLDTPDESIVKTFEVNSLSNFWTVKAFLPDMLETGRGHIVTIASLAGLFGSNRLVDYCASKFAAVGFDEALKNEIKVELGHQNIHSTLVCPYYINTGMFDGVRSKIIPLLKPEPVVNDIVAGILTNQEQIVVPRYVYALIVLKLIVPGEVGRRVASAFGITGAMLTFKGTNKAKSGKLNHSVLPDGKKENGITTSPKLIKNGRKQKK